MQFQTQIMAKFVKQNPPERYSAHQHNMTAKLLHAHCAKMQVSNVRVGLDFASSGFQSLSFCVVVVHFCKIHPWLQHTCHVCMCMYALLAEHCWNMYFIQLCTLLNCSTCLTAPFEMQISGWTRQNDACLVLCCTWLKKLARLCDVTEIIEAVALYCIYIYMYLYLYLYLYLVQG